jgi:hypothetical protein
MAGLLPGRGQYRLHSGPLAGAYTVMSLQSSR